MFQQVGWTHWALTAGVSFEMPRFFPAMPRRRLVEVFRAPTLTRAGGEVKSRFCSALAASVKRLASATGAAFCSAVSTPEVVPKRCGQGEAVWPSEASALACTPATALAKTRAACEVQPAGLSDW